MPNSESCSPAGPAALARFLIESAPPGQTDRLAEARLADVDLPQLGADFPQVGADDDPLKRVARGFAWTLYNQLVKQMQRTVDQGDGDDDEDDDSVKGGVQDLIGMFLPQALAAYAGDPLVRDIYERLTAQYGDRPDTDPSDARRLDESG